MPVLMRENTMIGNLAIKPGERESVSVTSDGEKTLQDLLYELTQKIDISKINSDSYVNFLGQYYRLNSLVQDTIQEVSYFMINFLYTSIGSSNKIKFSDIQLTSISKSGCKLDEKSINYTLDPASVSVEETSDGSEVLPSGYTFELYY